MAPQALVALRGPGPEVKKLCRRYRSMSILAALANPRQGSFTFLAAGRFWPLLPFVFPPKKAARGLRLGPFFLAFCPAVLVGSADCAAVAAFPSMRFGYVP